MIRRAGVSIARIETRRAQPADVDAIALAHVDSIRSIGSRFYPTSVVDDWQEGITGACVFMPKDLVQA